MRAIYVRSIFVVVGLVALVLLEALAPIELGPDSTRSIELWRH
jgi:hypothetical protein